MEAANRMAGNHDLETLTAPIGSACSSAADG
jgi:hypothetical protein